MEKIFIFIILAALIFCIGFFVYFWNAAYQEQGGTILEQVTYEPIENYEIIETEDGKFVENKNVGLRFKIPEGWMVTKGEPEAEKEIIVLSSPDSFVDTNNFPVSGCFIEVSVEHGEENFMSIQRQIEELSTASVVTDRELFSVGDKSGLKFSDTLLGNGKINFLKIPEDNKTFSFIWANLSFDETLCESYSDSFLKSVEFF